MFSVLMSLYNKERVANLNECLLSIQNQTLLPSEVVIVYDGIISEALSSVVETFQEKINIKVIKLERNVGLGKSLNIGIKHCQFNLVARMDTDDICRHDRFEKQIQVVNNDFELAILGTAIIEFDNIGHKRVKQLPISRNEIIRFSKTKNPFNHMSVVFRKDIIESCGGYHHHPFMEDYNLWLRVIASGHKVANLDDILVDARVGDGMVARRRGWEYIKSEIQLFHLKNELRITNHFNCLPILCIRLIPRILPVILLKYLYILDRKKSN